MWTCPYWPFPKTCWIWTMYCSITNTQEGASLGFFKSCLLKKTGLFKITRSPCSYFTLPYSLNKSSITSSICRLSFAPTKPPTTSPPFINFIQGMLLTPNSWAMSPNSSTSIMSRFTVCGLASATACNTGVNCRQGPHLANRKWQMSEKKLQLKISEIVFW